MEDNKMSNYYNIDKNAHYFVPMKPLFGIAGLVLFTSSNDPEHWTECVIDESRYQVDEGYKVTLVSIDPAYGSRDFYQCDFNSGIKCGMIVKKTPTMHVEIKSELIPLTSNVHLVNEYEDLVE